MADGIEGCIENAKLWQETLNNEAIKRMQDKGKLLEECLDKECEYHSCEF